MQKSFITAFWSPFHGQTGQSAAIASIGTYLGINFNLSTLLMHSQFTRSSLEDAFLAPDKNTKSILFGENGIDAVEKLARTKQLSDKSFTDYTTSLIPGRLEILAGTNKKSNELFSQLAYTLPYIMACARQSFHLVLCDVNSGLSSEITDIVLKNSDLVVVCLNQNLEVLNGYFEKLHFHPKLNDRRHLLLLGNYEHDSVYTSAYIKRLFGFKDEIYVLPRNTSLMDAHNSHDFLRYFFGNNEAGKNDKSYPVIQGISPLALRLLNELGISNELFSAPLKKHSIFDMLNIVKRRN